MRRAPSSSDEAPAGRRSAGQRLADAMVTARTGVLVDVATLERPGALMRMG